jgi:hypothetical protein
VRPPPRNPRGQRSEHHEEEARAPIAANGEGRRDENGDADRMDGVDLAVASAPPVVGLERGLEIRAVVAAGVVVLDREVVIGEQALRDDQIVRLVAARKNRRELQPPRRRAEDRDACRDD